MKCLVHGCDNQSHEGEFITGICSPCHTMLKTGRVGFGRSFIHRLYNDRIGALDIPNLNGGYRRVHVNDYLRAEARLSEIHQLSRTRNTPSTGDTPQ